MAKIEPIRIYVDGSSSSGGVGDGGWGVLFIIEGQEEGFHGGVKNTTNNRMELTAAISALKLLPVQNEIPVIVYSDSKYVIDGITNWINKWKQQNWVLSGKKNQKNQVEVKNMDLWQQLDKLNRRHKNLTWTWVKGHSGVYGNEMADALANEGKMSI